MTLEALDIEPGAEQYLPFAQHLLRRLKLTLAGCGLKHGRKELTTPDGSGTVEIRTRRGGGDEGAIDEWYDYIRIASSGGGYLFQPFLADRQTSLFSLANVSRTGIRYCYMPFNGGKFVRAPRLGYPYVHMLGDRASSKGYTPTPDGYIASGSFTALPNLYGTHGVFKHTYSDEFGVPVNAWISVRRDSVPSLPLLNTETGLPLSHSGIGSVSSNWIYSVTADGRALVMLGYSPGDGPYYVDVDAALPVQAVFTPLDTKYPGGSVEFQKVPTDTATQETWTNMNEAAGTGTWAKTINTTHGSSPYTAVVRNYAALAPDGSVKYVVEETRTGETADVTAEAYNFSWAKNGGGSTVYTESFSWSKSGSGHLRQDAPYEDDERSTITLRLPSGVSKTFEIGATVYSATASGAYDSDTAVTSISTSYTGTHKHARLFVDYCDPLGEFLIYTYDAYDSVLSRSTTLSTSNRTITTSSSRTVGILSAAHGDVVVYTEPGHTDLVETTTDLNLVTTPGIGNFFNAWRSDVYPTSYSLASLRTGNGSSSSSSSTGSGVTSVAAWSWGSGRPRRIITDVADVSSTDVGIRLSAAGRDPRNWVVSVNHFWRWNGNVQFSPLGHHGVVSAVGSFLDPNVFEVFTARLNNQAVKAAFLVELESMLRDAGQTAIADNVAAGILSPYAIQMHARSDIGVVVRNDSAASFVTDRLVPE